MKLVVDLDGTLSKVNTFRYWTIFAFLLPNKINKSNFISSVFIFINLYLLRLINLLSHWQMKRLFIIYWGIMQTKNDSINHSVEFNQNFAKFIAKRKVNQKVLNTIKELISEDKNLDVLLATAAPQFYAQHIANIFNMNCIASNILENDLQIDPFVQWKENVRENKFDNVKKQLLDEDFIIFTDHKDDFLLIKNAKKVYLVNPNNYLKEKVHLLNKDFITLTK